MHENKEMKLLTSLLKKEFLEYSRNKMNGILFIFTLLFALFVPAPVEVKQMKMTVDGAHLFVLLLVIAVMLIHQYMYDSCQNDFTSGGTIFMLNLNCPAWISGAAKGTVSLFMGICICLAGVRFVHSVDDLFPLFLLFAVSFTAVSLFDYCISILLRKATVASYVLDVAFGSLLLIPLAIDIPLLLKCTVCAFSFLFSYAAFSKAFRSKSFRASLK